jgi:hypothetical protein
VANRKLHLESMHGRERRNDGGSTYSSDDDIIRRCSGIAHGKLLLEPIEERARERKLHGRGSRRNIEEKAFEWRREGWAPVFDRFMVYVALGVEHLSRDMVEVRRN